MLLAVNLNNLKKKSIIIAKDNKDVILLKENGVEYPVRSIEIKTMIYFIIYTWLFFLMSYNDL